MIAIWQSRGANGHRIFVLAIAEMHVGPKSAYKHEAQVGCQDRGKPMSNPTSGLSLEI